VPLEGVKEVVNQAVGQFGVRGPSALNRAVAENRMLESSWEQADAITEPSAVAPDATVYFGNSLSQ